MSRNFTTWAALTMAMLGAALTFYLVRGDDVAGDAPREHRDVPATISGPSVSEAAADRHALQKPKVVTPAGPSPQSTVLPAQNDIERRSPIVRADQPQRQSAAGDHPASPAEPNADDDEDGRSVIGRSFPVSESVAAYCLSLGDDDEICRQTREFLKQMAAEPRDPSWARTAEALLRKQIQESDRMLSIRHLECRSSVCAVEVESRVGPWVYVYRDRPRSLLSYRLDTPGLERADDGVKIVVTLRIYNRM
jgi:hypothetical protein